jgi:hypothetical protein
VAGEFLVRRLQRVCIAMSPQPQRSAMKRRTKKAADLPAEPQRPAGIQAMDRALYQRVRQALRRIDQAPTRA